jgi:hypothetical protein
VKAPWPRRRPSSHWCSSFSSNLTGPPFASRRTPAARRPQYHGRITRIRFRFDNAIHVHGFDDSDVKLLQDELDTSSSPGALTAAAKIKTALASEATKLTFDVEERTAILETLGTELDNQPARLRELYHELRDESNRHH